MLSTRALATAEASLVSPLLTFNPAFTLLAGWLILGEIPGLRETLGVIVILLGAYLLDVEEIRTSLLAPIRLLLRRPGTLLAIVASACWGVTTVFEKLAIQHVDPPSGPLVALAGTALTVMLLTPGACLVHHQTPPPSDGRDGRDGRAHLWWGGPDAYLRLVVVAALLAGIAPLFGFTAIALGQVGYVTALFKLSAIVTILWARLFLGEGNMRSRLFGANVVVVGGALVV